MSDQELNEMMNAAPVAANSVVAAPVSAAHDVNIGSNEEKNDIPHVTTSDCMSVYDFVTSNAAITTAWKKVKLVKDDGSEITDTKNVLVGINDCGTPITFDCNNLYIPTVYLSGVTSIKVLISGIIIMQPNADIYVTKNNVYVYVKDAETHNRVKLVKYLKAKKDMIQFVEQGRDTNQTVDAEYTKFIIKATGGRLFNVVSELTELDAMKAGVLKFLAEKVSDINYCIKIEDICLQLGF